MDYKRLIKKIIGNKNTARLSQFRNVVKQKSFKGDFLLNSMRKSGSHYFMLVLANYLSLNCLNNNERLGILEMKNRIWNVRKKSVDLTQIQNKTGYRYWNWQHENRYLKYNNSKFIVHLYRNPLDLIVSRFFYNYKNRINYHGPAKHPRDIIDSELQKIVAHISFIKEAEKKRKIKKIAYENLIRSSEYIFIDLFEVAQIDLDPLLLKTALERSEKKFVKRDEEEKYKVKGSNVVGRNMNESFVRSGKIGEWKHFFDDNDYKKIERALLIEKINLNDYILS